MKLVAGFYLSFPIGYLLLSAIVFDVPARQCLSVLLSPFYYLVSICAVIVGYGLWEMKRWAWYLFVFANVLIAYQNALVVNNYSQSHNKALAFVASLIVILFLVYRVAKEIRVPYFFPKIRWWESDPRYRLSVPVSIKRDGAETADGEILDLSLGGCFVKLRTLIAQDELLHLEFVVFGHKIEVQGNVVWRTQSTVTHPRGVGVKFDQLGRDQKKALRQVNQRLRKIAVLYRRSRYLMNQDEFLKQLQELEGTPRGDGAKTG